MTLLSIVLQNNHKTMYLHIGHYGKQIERGDNYEMGVLSKRFLQNYVNLMSEYALWYTIKFLMQIYPATLDKNINEI